jgi:predicted HAD superfamily Cof-like phosphohydrolase
MKHQINQVREFMFMSDQEINHSPRLVSPELSKLRYELMKEENEEYLTACEDGNLVEIADALGDELYILVGTILTHGMQHKIEDVFNLIHSNNMMKCPDGICEFREDGKLKKPANFKPVDLKQLF